MKIEKRGVGWPLLGPAKILWEGTYTYIYILGHCDSMTDPAQRTESVKMLHNLLGNTT